MWMGYCKKTAVMVLCSEITLFEWKNENVSVWYKGIWGPSILNIKCNVSIHLQQIMMKINKILAFNASGIKIREIEVILHNIQSTAH